MPPVGLVLLPAPPPFEELVVPALSLLPPTEVWLLPAAPVVGDPPFDELVCPPLPLLLLVELPP